MTDVEHYLVGEHIEDFNSGLISRRELLRRVTLITGSMASTLVLLEVAGCQGARASLLERPPRRHLGKPARRNHSPRRPLSPPWTE